MTGLSYDDFKRWLSQALAEDHPSVGGTGCSTGASDRIDRISNALDAHRAEVLERLAALERRDGH